MNLPVIGILDDDGMLLHQECFEVANQDLGLSCTNISTSTLFLITFLLPLLRNGVRGVRLRGGSITRIWTLKWWMTTERR